VEPQELSGPQRIGSPGIRVPVARIVFVAHSTATDPAEDVPGGTAKSVVASCQQTHHDDLQQQERNYSDDGPERPGRGREGRTTESKVDTEEQDAKASEDPRRDPRATLGGGDRLSSDRSGPR
jgi:hypothetical protein